MNLTILTVLACAFVATGLVVASIAYLSVARCLPDIIRKQMCVLMVFLGIIDLGSAINALTAIHPQIVALKFITLQGGVTWLFAVVFVLLRNMKKSTK